MTEIRNPKVGIICGSKSDLPVIEKAEKQLKEFGIDYDVTVASAHRTPKEVEEYAKSSEEKYDLIIAAAGRAVAENFQSLLFHCRSDANGRYLPSERCGRPITALVTGLCLNTFNADLSHFFLQGQADIIDGAAGTHTLFNRAEIGFIRLREVSGKGDNLYALFRQPMRDGAAVQPARGGKSNCLAFKIFDVHAEVSVQG